MRRDLDFGDLCSRPVETPVKYKNRVAPDPERIVTDDIDTLCDVYEHNGVHLVRVGQGSHATQVVTVTDERFHVTIGQVGFPTISWKAMPEGVLSAGLITAAPPGARWCGYDLEPGDLLLYGPSSEHAARNVPGLGFTYVTLDTEQLDQHADELGVDIIRPGPGEVRRLRRSPLTDPVEASFLRYRDVASHESSPTPADADDILTSITHCLIDDQRADRTGGGRRLDSRSIVHACIDYAQSIGRLPSLSELCLVANVSERRVRQAFSEEFGLPPTRVFRAWALSEAHRRLVHPDEPGGSVTEVAMDLGFGHLGRFTGHYKRIFGHTPSQRPAVNSAGSTNTIHHVDRRTP